MESSRPRSSGFVAPRRVFTAPVAPSAPPVAASPQSTGGLVDTLYDHPNVKIVSFTAGARSLSIGPWAAAGQDIEPGSLSWSSQLERTIAVGPFRIYRAPGSVAFLSCGSALQPILPKSQAWCVDEESSKFVLQVRRPQYWRIEVPVEQQEDVRLAQQLRDVFDTILQFEKTECPFNRSFTVELPERPQTPVKKRPWTPARRSSESLPLTPVTPVTPVEIARLHKGTPRGSFCMGDLRTAGDARRAWNEHIGGLEPPTEEPVSTESGRLGTGRRNNDATARPNRVRADRPRSISAAPPHIVPLIVAPPLKFRETGRPNVPAEPPRFSSPTDSSESFHNPKWLSAPLPPSPPLSTPGSPRSSSHQLQTQHMLETADTQDTPPSHTITFNPSQTWSVATADSLFESECSAATAASSVHDPDCTSPCSPPQPAGTTEPPAPTPTKEALETPCKPPSSTPTKEAPETPSKPPSSTPTRTTSPSSSTRSRRPAIRRATTSSSISSSRRPLSPLPSAANLLTPRRASPAATPNNNNNNNAGTTSKAALVAAVRRLPMTMIHKTCEILMSPPSHLMSLMLKVAARIAAGEWRGLVFGMGEAGERVSVTWDWSDDDDNAAAAAAPPSRGSGAGGWNTGTNVFGNRGVEDFWLRGRHAGRERLKMAGAFPESDDDEEDDDEVGPLDHHRPLRNRDQSSRSSPVARKEEERRRDGGGERGKQKYHHHDDGSGGAPVAEEETEWGVD
ncbi:inheritance of peroxisomes protein 1-domain-containing protein [Chaetomidium leptoderma]|uniref:Inheritance of peroxisomes protein 1 n=1 Tax=Chaetomidium leptoderma TaxID=669021 RepID=A0AAN6ZZS6_9PEZI|nr:inheritance of peroxisomes protein 1-domain-containing protein [Chaetomidium leptoderma]